MKLSDIMSAANLTLYPRIALVLFLFAFLLVVVRIYWPGARAQFAREAALPLDDVNDRFATGRAQRPDRPAATHAED
ncbi:MAG TPA: CcoQ/FixQ family Cbb3-type cytochrome c oxidase assembly chaperone [Gemmatimonadales bacterium]